MLKFKHANELEYKVLNRVNNLKLNNLFLDILVHFMVERHLVESIFKAYQISCTLEKCACV